MSKRVQHLGHPAETANTFVGLEREITIDTDNRELRIHDGATEGGRKILDRDANDNRYQARSTELDGLLGWEPNERGFTVRLGPANYRLRSITVNGLNLTIENENGYDGNPLISLAPAIESDHTWSGENTFTQPIAANGGVVGDLVGDSAGTHTGDVVGNVTGNLTGNANGDHTGSFEGDANFEGFGVNFADEQILLAWLEPAILSYIADKGVPVGTIVAFNGAEVDIPDNWLICDGLNGTPDLRDRFIVGAGTEFPVDDVGGQLTHAHTVMIDAGGAHTHTGTADGTSLTVAQMPAHTHGNGVTDNVTGDVFSRGNMAAATTTPNSIESNSSDGIYEGITESKGSGDPHTHALTIDSGGAHTHTGTTAAADTLPPYYALIYIMKGS